MSKSSSNKGKAFEFACLKMLEKEISKIRPVAIVQNSSFYIAQEQWNRMDPSLQSILKNSSFSAIATLFELEPLIIENGTDTLELEIQSDKKGVVGDVRDILIIRRGIEWEIGLSIKHNHFAVKHSRLSKTIDFGERWFGIKCSRQYWNEIEPIFTYLKNQKELGLKWNELNNKHKIYIDILKAFMEEIQRSYILHGSAVPKKMVEYLLGKFDFYKVISIDKKLITQIQAFNIRGTLNKAAQRKGPSIQVPIPGLPNRILHIDFKPGSTNTVEMCLDEGWQFSFRIHNASTKVEPSLKFDVQIIGMPTAIITIDCNWWREV